MSDQLSRQALEARILELEKQVADQKAGDIRIKILSQAMASSPVSVVITDHNGVIEYVNPKFEFLTGYTLAEAVGKNPSVLNAGVQPKDYYRDMWQKISAGRDWKGEFCNRKKNGELYWEQALISPILNEAGRITHFVAVKEDITERKRMTEELSRAKVMAESANQAKNEFLANMSHELRTPLNAIIGFSEVLQEGYFGGLNEKQHEYVADILGSGRHLLSLINDILDLAKIESGKMELETTRFAVHGLLENSLFMIKEKALKHGISLSVNMPESDRALEITADERKLKQVLFNLLSNAAKFTPDGGGIVLGARKIADFAVRRMELTGEGPPSGNGVHAVDQGPGVEIRVSDTGIGLDAEDLPHLFDEFYQVETGMSRQGPGTGLGLPLARRFVELHGGVIWVKSRGAELGSIFGFVLPLEVPPAAVEMKPQKPVKQLSPVQSGDGFMSHLYAPTPGAENPRADASSEKTHQLTEKLALFQQLILQSNDAIFMVRESTGRIVDMNNQACRSLGYTRDELLKMTVLDIEVSILHSPREWKAHVNEMRVSNGKILRCSHRRKDGSIFPVEISLRHVHYQNDDYIVAIARDMSAFRCEKEC